MAKLSELKPGTHRKVLVYGPSGTGKTVFALGAPGRKYVYDFDSKLTSAAEYYSKDQDRLAETDYDVYSGIIDGKRPIQRFDEHLRKLETLADKREFPYDVGVLDSFSLFVDAMLTEIVTTNGAIQRTRTSQTPVAAMLDYRIQNVHVKNILGRLLALPWTFIMTAHVKMEKDELTGRVERMPSAPGGLATHLPIIFEEVYRTFVEVKNGERTYKAQTQADDSYPARSQIRGISPVITLDYAALAPRA